MGDPVRPGPITQRLVGQGPCALPGVREKSGSGRCRHRPLRRVQGARKNGRGRTPPLRKRYKRCGEVKNPPVTALPCQPPLGKGTKGTGDADCHSQCAHWLRNDRGFYKGCGGESAGGQRRPPLRRAYKECGKRAVGDAGPYESATRSSVNGPPGICRRGLPFGFLGKKIPASKAGSILPYYGGGDNARKKFAGGEILSHTMIFF